MITARITGRKVAGPGHMGATAASAELARSLGSAFGAAAAVLFGLLTAWNPETAGLFFNMVRKGPRVPMALTADRLDLARAEIASIFSGVFVLVAGISCLSALMAATPPVRRLWRAVRQRSGFGADFPR